MQETISHYKITGRIGAGGMGEVYLAEDARLGRKVAIKVLPPQFTSDPERIRRFAQEARAASSLNHPHIITIFDIGEDNGQHFIASEFVEGSTLRQLITKARLPISEALDVAIQASSALSAAHEAGIIHRDIKPENVIRRPDSYIKLLDFGLAKLTESVQSDSATSETEVLHTEPGRVLGTVAYMSPEQARGLKLDGRSDIFSLGVVLYELLTGSRPFGGATTSDAIVSLLERKPARLSTLLNDVPEEVENIVARSLEKDADARYQTAGDMLRDLKRAKARFDSAETRSLAASTPADESVTVTSSSPSIPTPPSDVYATSLGASASTGPTRILPRKSTGVWIVLGSLALVMIALSAWWFYTRDDGRIGTLAVLPFTNESPGRADEYVSDGITESLINQLSQLPEINVISRNSVFALKGKTIDVPKLRQDLGVQALLFGTLRHEGDDVVINTELVDARTQRQIWGEGFRRKATDVLALQEQIVRAIAERLRSRLAPDARNALVAMPTNKSDAYDLYLRARYFFNQGTPNAIKKADELFEQAASIDPKFMLAAAGCAASHALGGDFDKAPDACMPKARTAALHVIKRNDRIPDAHLTLARVSWSYDRDFATAERTYKRAISLNPSNADAHAQYAEMLALQDRKDDARTEIKRALELAPASAAVARTAGLIDYYDRRYDDAIENLRRAITLDAGYWPAREMLGRVYEVKGLKLEALEEYLRSRFLVEPGSERLKELKTAYGSGNWVDYWRKDLETLKKASATSYVPHTVLGDDYLRLDDPSHVFEELNRAIDARDGYALAVRVDPIYDSLRSDPRFDPLLKRLVPAR